MRPHRLRLTAFGPFPGEVDVDLDALAAGGLFLLHGPTGAGKTTLLDAMCFALYGRVPGVRGIQRLRSDHAAPGASCAVTLELSVGGRRLRVTRSPAFERPKKRGGGTTTEQGSIRVEERRGDAWTTWSTRPGEADAEIADLVGMTAEQFCRVVLLPQGAFAAFLHADADQRAQLLARLFATDRFARAEDWLGEHRRAVAERLAAASAGRDALVARVAQEAAAAVPDSPDLDWYDATLAEVAAALALARTEAVAAAAAAESAAAEHRTAVAAAGALARRDAARGALEALRAGEPAAAAARAAVAGARAVAPLVAVADRAEQTTAAHRAATAAAAEAAAAVFRPEAIAAATAANQPAQPEAHAAAAANQPEAHAAVLRAAAEAERTRGGRLQALVPQAERTAADAARAQAAAGARAAAEQRAQAAAGELRDLPARRAEATTALAAASRAAAALPAALAEAERLAGAATDAAVAADLAGRLEPARSAAVTAREQAVTAGENVLALRTALLEGQAARLAALLVDGAPCAVCGATEHPAPARGGGALPDEPALAAAETAAAQAAERSTAAVAALAALSASEQLVRDRLAAAGWADPAGLPAAQSAAAAALDALRTAAAEHETAAAAVTAHDERAATLRTDLARAHEQQAAAARAYDEAAAAAAAGAAALAAELGGEGGDLTTALAASSARADALDAAATLAADAARLAGEAAAADAALAEVLAGAGLADLAALRAAALPPATVSGLAEQVSAYDAALAAARAAPELTLPDVPGLDPTAAGALADERAAARDGLAAAAAVLADRHARLAALGPALRRAVDDLAPLTAEHAEAAAVAELARGQNARGMRLSSYVLAARLEQVAAAASTRLGAMSDGRYALRHTDARGDGRRRSGLGLEVSDAWTGLVRQTGTLSGGETFVASLALALGLADTVTAEAGGAPIEALFVDEGFGSLDSDTLEEVMDVLDGLRSGGRVVGIVSHVADLRARIPAQLQVLKHPDGSTVRIVA